ncbi:MAG: response regulator [Gemmataceae bacterium]
MSTPSTETPRILVIDDDLSVLKMLRTALTRSELRITTATNGAEGLAVYQANAGDIDLILSDIQMPVMNGIELAQYLQRVFPEMRVCLMTGQGLTSNEAVPENVLHVFQKPFDCLQTTADSIREMIKQKSCC